MSLAPDDRAQLITELLGRLRALESDRDLSLDTILAMDHDLIDAMPDKSFGGAVTASKVVRVSTVLPDGNVEEEGVRVLTMPKSKFVPTTPADPDPSVDAAMIVATLALDDAPVFVESANVQALAQEVLDAAFAGAEGDASLWLDAVMVQKVPMTRCAAALAAADEYARATQTDHTAFYRRAPAPTTRASMVLNRIAGATAPWARLVRAAFGRIPGMRASATGAVQVVGPRGIRAVNLARVVAPTPGAAARADVPARRGRRAAAPGGAGRGAEAQRPQPRQRDGSPGSAAMSRAMLQPDP